MITSRFQHCFAILLDHEGGYSNHKADRGSATNYGVTQKTYNAFRAQHGLKARPVTDITREEVEAIYNEYWAAAWCQRMPEPLDLLIFDFAINSGAGRAVKTLQRTLGVSEDGIVGQDTLSAIREEIRTTSITRLCLDYINYREDFLHDLVDRDASQEVFLAGWQNRLNHLRELVVEESA